MSVRLHVRALGVEDVHVHPTEEDLEVLQEWWGRLAPEVPGDAKGLWFGITDLVRGGALRTLYVAGCSTFDSVDSSGKWATGYCWWPADRHVSSAHLAMLPDQPYQEVLAYAAALVRSLGPTKERNVEGAAVGYVDGAWSSCSARSCLRVRASQAPKPRKTRSRLSNSTNVVV